MFSGDDLSHQTLKGSQLLLTKRLEILAMTAYLSLIKLPIAMMSHPAIAVFAVAWQMSLFTEQPQLTIRCHSFPFLLREFQEYLLLLLPQGTITVILNHFQWKFEVLSKLHDWFAIARLLQDRWRELKLWYYLRLYFAELLKDYLIDRIERYSV